MKITAGNWDTTDSDEIERRKLRAKAESFHVENIEPDHPYFGSFTVVSAPDKRYLVEIRSLTENINSCDCSDYKSNGLGTCKHIEHVILHLQKKKKIEFRRARVEGNYRPEIFFDYRDSIIRIDWPKNITASSRKPIDQFFSADGTLIGNPIATYPMLLAALNDNQPGGSLRISQHIIYAFQYQLHQSQMQSAKEMFLQDVEQGKKTLDIIKHPLYRYQQEGMLHLAFTKRALLADEMGLGKTVQAIAACELLRRHKKVQRVLIVATVSLKGEWEEQIAKFTGLSNIIIQGTRADRLRQYQRSAFFYICNYEQVVADRADIQRLIAPDIIILDEAQRIKNWQTKTAEAVKQLKSEYAFVLTGTPLENRIDDIYSLVQFLDPHIFGSLFRFNRNFYELDERGKPIGYKNLDELHTKLRPIMLRRKKCDVEGELPSRTLNNYFVAMHEEQLIRYNDYKSVVAQMVSRAKHRPLLKAEFEKLQGALACMRMVCDSPYILDPDCRISPKIDELATILEELLLDESTKIIIFSEWERMLQLVQELVKKKKGVDFALHTGSIPQIKRRENIKRFKEDPNCRIFLSTDSGSIGLNLQNANVVINLDLPWNPSKLEQRIARAWRKHQTRSVTVINLVCEYSIEHRMLGLLDQKSTLAQSVLDGEGNLKSMNIPSARASFVQQMEELVDCKVVNDNDNSNQSQPVPKQIQNVSDLIPPSISDKVDLLQSFRNEETGHNTVLVVAETKSDCLRKEILQSLGHEAATFETLDRETFDTIQRLVELGILKFNPAKTLLRSDKLSPARNMISERQIANSRKESEQALRKQRMAQLLIDGGFYEESLPALRESLISTMNAFAWLKGVFTNDIEPISHDFIKIKLIEQQQFPQGALVLFMQLNDAAEKTPDTVKNLLEDSKVIFECVRTELANLA